jgi:hypothetical protein
MRHYREEKRKKKKGSVSFSKFERKVLAKEWERKEKNEQRN